MTRRAIPPGRPVTPPAAGDPSAGVEDGGDAWTPSLDPPRVAVVDAVTRAIAEDLLPLGDLTAGLVPAGRRATVDVVSRAAGVIAGRACAVEAFAQIDPGGGGDLAPPRRRRRWPRATSWPPSTARSGRS